MINYIRRDGVTHFQKFNWFMNELIATKIDVLGYKQSVVIIGHELKHNFTEHGSFDFKVDAFLPIHLLEGKTMKAIESNLANDSPALRLPVALRDMLVTDYAKLFVEEINKLQFENIKHTAELLEVKNWNCRRYTISGSL